MFRLGPLGRVHDSLLVLEGDWWGSLQSAVCSLHCLHCIYMNWKMMPLQAGAAVARAAMSGQKIDVHALVLVT